MFPVSMEWVEANIWSQATKTQLSLLPLLVLFGGFFFQSQLLEFMLHLSPIPHRLKANSHKRTNGKGPNKQLLQKEAADLNTHV